MKTVEDIGVSREELDEMPSAMRKRARNLILLSPAIPADIEGLIRHFPGIAVGRYTNDFNLGAGQTHIGVEAFGDWGVSMLVLHTHTPNNPVGFNPLAGEGIILDMLSRDDLTALIDMLTAARDALH